MTTSVFATLSDSPRVSWVICAHYINPFFKQAIQSCLNQSFDDFEILIIANGSKSNLIQEYINNEFPENKKIKVVCTLIEGLIFSLNLGIHHAQGEFIARMDFDDEAMPNRLLHQINFMDKNPSISVLGGSLLLLDDDGNLHGSLSYPTHHDEIVKALYFRNPVCHPTALIRRDVLLKVGGYMGGIHAEDYDLWTRLVEKGYKFGNLSDCLIKYRMVGGESRGVRDAYASQAGSQARNLFKGNGISWAFSMFLTYLKIICSGFKSALRHKN